jgi:AraC family transcriptional regulator
VRIVQYRALAGAGGNWIRDTYAKQQESSRSVLHSNQKSREGEWRIRCDHIEGDIAMETGEYYMAQEDGSFPMILAGGSARGESGVSVLSLRFLQGLHFRATTQHHLVWFQSPVQIECRMADRTLWHEAPAGSLAICPSGMDCAADAGQNVDAIIVAIDPAKLTLAAAEDSMPRAQLIERLRGYDEALLDLARILVVESADDYREGPLFWSEVANNFVDGLIARHTSKSASQARGTLGKDVLMRIKDYVFAHIDEPIEVSTLASMAGRSPFHFSRVFTRCVGMTPHRYVVHLRLQRAIELVREGQSSFAEIAARTGFADQSHLSRWVRRVRGVSLSQIVA